MALKIKLRCTGGKSEACGIVGNRLVGETLLIIEKCSSFCG